MNQIPSTPSPQEPARWALIDGTGLLHRAHHAFATMKGPDGHATGVLHGTLNFVNKMMKGMNGPDHAIAIFDPRGGSFERQALYPAYKAQRPPRPEEITRQEPWVHAFLKASGIPVVSVMGVESDDVLAAIAKKECTDKKMAILSADKDMGQVVGGNIMWFKPDSVAEGGVARMTTRAVIDKFGVHPKQLRDFLALQGDTSDNLPGVEKVGEKTAAKLLNAFGSIDKMYEALSDGQEGKQKLELAVGAATAKKIWVPLQEAKDWIHTMVSLVDLRVNTPVPRDLYANREPVNDQLMAEMRAEHGLPPWMGYFLPWQQERAALMNQAKRTAPSAPAPKF